MATPGAVGNGRYQITRRIGQGGMGAVYEALDTRLGNQVALKQLTVSSKESDLAFEREARLLARLRHAALPVVSDYFVEDGARFLVMQFIPGDDLATMLEQRPAPFLVPTVLGWADTILGALEYLHQQQPPIVHRDIKPHNLKLTPQGDIVLLDFGLAKGDAGALGQTAAQVSLLAYTLNYAPLEQLQQMGTEPRSDLYALGVTLYQLLTGVVPPSALERAAMQYQGLPDPLRLAHEINQAIPAPVSAALQRAAALKIADRFASAVELRRALCEASAPRVKPAQPGPWPVASPAQPYSAPVSVPHVPVRGAKAAVASPPPVSLPPVGVTLPVTPSAQGVISPASQSGKGLVPVSSRRLFAQWMIMNLVWWLICCGFGLMIGPATIAVMGLAIGLSQWVVLRRVVADFPTALWLAANGVIGPVAFIVGFGTSALLVLQLYVWYPAPLRACDARTGGVHG